MAFFCKHTETRSLYVLVKHSIMISYHKNKRFPKLKRIISRRH